MKINIEIKNRFTGKIIFEFETENNTIAKTISEYIRQTKEKKGLYACANLRDANLMGAYLRGADLRGTDLRDANLSGAYLRDADLSGTDLRDADLSGAYLSGAYLRDAYLRGADLRGTDLRDADIMGAELMDANLMGAELMDIKADFFMILLSAKKEVEGLKNALINGKIDGSTYEGNCCCLVGTIANVKGCNYGLLPNIKPDVSRPAERWFLGIKKNDTPENSIISKITLEWIEEFETLINS